MTIQRLSTAAKSLLTGDIDRAVKSFSLGDEDFMRYMNGGVYAIPNIEIRSSEHRVPTSDLDGRVGAWNYQYDGDGHNYFKYLGLGSAQTAYETCAPLAAIVNKKAQAHINGNRWVLKRKDQRESNSAEARAIRKLFANPNPLQTQKQFEAQAYIYMQVFGFTLILSIKPFGFKDNIDAYNLWNLPPSMVDIEETKKLFYQTDTLGIIKQIVLNYKGEKTVIDAGDIFIMRDFVPSFSSLILPESRISEVSYPVSNILGAYNSRGMLLHARGALGIISQDASASNPMGGTLPMMPEDKQQLQNDFKRYGIKKDQWQFIITKAALKWQQIGIPTRELMLFEEIEADTMALCDTYNYPFRLMSSNSTNSLGGTDAAIFGRQLYTNTIIPESLQMDEQWDKFFGLQDTTDRLDKDFSHVDVLQEDKVAKGRARKELNQALLIEWQNNLITWNQWQEELGKDTVQGMDIYYSDMAQAGKIFGGGSATKPTNDGNEQGSEADEREAA